MARYFKATVTGITGPIWVSAALKAQFVKYIDPADDKEKFAGTAASPCLTNKAASGEVRTEIDHSSKFGTTSTNVTVSFTEASGGSALSKIFPVVVWNRWKGETSAEDSKPGRFSLQFEAQIPT